MDNKQHSDDEWLCEMVIGIDELRMLYDHICYSIEVWPGTPKRPYTEQQLLMDLKTKCFAMIMEYNITHSESNK